MAIFKTELSTRKQPSEISEPQLAAYSHSLGRHLCEAINWAGVDATMSPSGSGFILRFSGISVGILGFGSLDKPDFSTFIFETAPGAKVFSGVVTEFTLEGEEPPSTGRVRP